MFRRIALYGLVVALTGCATPYMSSGPIGGYTRAEAPGRLEKVVFNGNGFTRPDVVQLYALYRCAEIAKAKGKPYFLIYDNLIAASLDKSAELPTLGMVGSGKTSFAFVLFLDQPRPHAKETEKVLADLGELIKQNSLKSESNSKPKKKRGY